MEPRGPRHARRDSGVERGMQSHSRLGAAVLAWSRPPKRRPRRRCHCLCPTAQVREHRDAKVVQLETPPSEAAAAHGSPLGVTFFPSDAHQGGYVSLLRKESPSE